MITQAGMFHSVRNAVISPISGLSWVLFPPQKTTLRFLTLKETNTEMVFSDLCRVPITCRCRCCAPALTQGEDMLAQGRNMQARINTRVYIFSIYIFSSSAKKTNTLFDWNSSSTCINGARETPREKPVLMFEHYIFTLNLQCSVPLLSPDM